MKSLAGGLKMKVVYILAILFILSSCVPGSSITIPTTPPALGEMDGTPTLTPFLPEGYSFQPTVTAFNIPGNPTQSQPQYVLWISPAVPDALKAAALSLGYTVSGDPVGANTLLDVEKIPDAGSSSWIYALVAPFPTTVDGVDFVDVRNAWSGIPGESFSGRPIWLDEQTLAAFSTLWGMPAPGSVQIAPAGDLLDLAWSNQPAWGIIPFDLLDPRWKVLSVDGQSPIQKEFIVSNYPLTVRFSLEPAVFPLPASNRDPEKMTILAMTGVTALVRATADQMEQHGILYPGEEVRSVLRAADITHVSNEIPFEQNCPTPDPWTDSLVFCSDPRYISLLEDIGTDIIELSGNHLLDYGPEAALATIDMYEQRNWLMFAGGRNLEDSFKPAILEDHGNKLAFIGCNLVGPPGDFPTETRPGSTPCDLNRIGAEISSLRQRGYLPIMTFQYQEYYQPQPSSGERVDFQTMADAGAIIVSGSQSHVPAVMAFSGDTFIHYGLGNLFFDQMSHLMPDGSLIYDTRNLFIDRHVIYNGRHISTELLTYIIEDYSRPRLMTGEERLRMLTEIFQAGGW